MITQLLCSLRTCFFLGAFLLCAASVPAQEAELDPPPLPDFAMPPPDPETLAPPPEVEWEPLTEQDSREDADVVGIVSVPPPEVEAPIAPPPPPLVETLVPGEPDAAEIALVEPQVEVWREQSESPQIPARSLNRLEQTYVAGTDSVVLRVQFDPLAAGKEVYMMPGPGIAVEPADAVLTISPSGECIVSVLLEEGIDSSHIIFYCEGIKTVLPVARASLAKVEEREALSGGGL
jgi:hypothetical protein